MLANIIEKQKEFQRAVNIPIDSLVDTDRNSMTETYLFLAIKEIIELSREFPSVANPWSKHNKRTDLQRIKEEFSDILMFLINIAIVWKLIPSEILDQLKKTQENNFLKIKTKKMDILNADILKVPNVISGIGQGNLSPDYIFVGQNPGKNITQGYKFWSNDDDGSSKVLLPILDELGIRDQSYFTNVVKCTTPDNQEPDQKLTEFYEEFLQKELEIILTGMSKKPILVTMGGWSSEALKKYTHVSIKHPSYVLRGGITREEYKTHVQKNITPLD
mgnify:CR=1 FL=1